MTFWAVSEMVKAHAGILDSDTPHETEAKLRRTLEELLDEEAPPLPHIGPLVG